MLAGVIEQRIHEELQAYMDRLPRKARKQNELRVGVAPGAPPGGTKLHIPPPRLEDFEDDSTVGVVGVAVGLCGWMPLADACELTCAG